VITHDRAIAERFPRRIETLDGRIVTDTAHHGDCACAGSPA
jgi:ABC-type lipoprotein export system ATPase subunit